MKAAHSLFFICLLAISASHSASAQLTPGHSTDTATGATSTGTTTTNTATTTAGTSTTDTNTTTPPASSTSPTSNTQPTNTSTTPPPNTTAPPTTPISNTNTTPPPEVTSQSTATDATGGTTVVIVTNTPSTTSESATATPSAGADDDGAGSGLGTGSIVGIAVAGGVAVIALIGFIVWKFTRKRFTDFDDNEAIKWPELNAHGENVASHPLPVNNTGRSGFDTGSEASLSRVPSTSNYSTPDVSGAHDPYAVPPLPHMNPNQPYRDDPTAASGYYDPYRGPVPGTLEHGAGEDWAGEVIPMTQMAGRSSPGPQAAYGVGGYDAGRQSPAPYGAGRAGSPGPQAAYGGRASPGPQAAYGGRASPGPQAAYTAGRASPGQGQQQQGAFDLYGAR
ncbi:hypothetical protein H0H87_003699 [Tephrocybe sp. NHM501043]|nr:hypothetical protein H0H87_003699 [Tephrocybe sp. NHM501043]